MSILSTIPEATSREEKGGDDDKSRLRVALPLDDDLSVHIRAIPMSPKGNHNHHRITEVQLLIDAASQRASQGNEAKALEIYEDCLGILEEGVRKLSEQMEASVSSKPRFQNTALSIILHEEWAEIALVIADVRTAMAILYERNEDYEEAIGCCETARSIYERQAVFDEKHCKKGSSARVHEDAMETMMERINEAKETQDIRRSLHDTVERIQDKLEATTDQTSRRFLYEDIFDKLSTVLSLELMYLGQTHPQIAITKGLLSTFYMELGQTEKALQAINEAAWICEMSLGDSHPRTGATYYESASLYEQTGGAQNAVKAIDLYEKCIATLQKAEGRVSDQLSSAMNRAGALYTQHDRLDDALQRLKGAILVIQEENQHRERSGAGSAEPVGIWLNLGECYRLRNEQSLAATAYCSALRSQRSSRKAYQKAFGDGVKNNLPEALRNPAIVSTLKLLGMSLARGGRFEKSYDCFLEALALVQSDFDAAQESAKLDTSIDLPSHLDRVASVLYELAKAKHQDGKCVEAMKLYEESLQLRTDSDRKRGTAADGKDRQQKQQQQQQQQQLFSTNAKHCAMSLVGVGLIHLLDNQHPTEAFNSFDRAVSCLPWDEKHEQIIATLLWDQSRFDSDSCGTKQRGGGRSITQISESTAQMMRRLEKKAETFRKSREHNHCLKTMELVIGVKRYHLQLLLDQRATAEADADDGPLPSSDGRDQNHNNDDEDEQVQAAKRNLADSLITMGEIVLIFTNAKKKSTDYINEARDLLNGSNSPKGCADTEKLLRQVNQLRRSIRRMKQRSETMAEF
eukprot:CAMPEP_0172384512 /NCGR_PEP_ID=MMETSP1061-20121228/2249_1 /TAXON_ID=37318 /ORGANISM="Pseudo-nitzschia pungens, Strain cf. pungens" /LENGTH=801 /DNA_ID=CAMNT_0013113149 /DNA_START=460 /DNA_END=2865 /DNA_ORIENTATION=-